MLSLTVLLFLVPAALAWDNEEMDLFDLVEEVNKHFYVIMGLDQATATSRDVRDAYKKLDLVLHADEKFFPDFKIQFRQLALIYDVLKDNTMREMYDWRNHSFYFNSSTV